MHPQRKKGRNLHSLCLAFLCAALLNSLIVSAETSEDIEAIDRLFAEAMEALDKDDLRTARRRFQAIVNGNPALHRARLELARVYYLSLDYDKARAETQTVLDDPNTPDEVRTTLLAFLAQIDKDHQDLERRHRLSATVYLGAVYDSNVNVGPDRDTVEINGSTLALNDASSERDDLGVVTSLGLNHVFSPGSTFELGERSGFFLWQSQANLYYRRYLDEDSFHLGVLTARTGPAWVVPRYWRAGIGLQLDHIRLGGEQLALFTSLNPNIAWQWGTQWELSVDTVITRRDYHDSDNAPRDGDYLAASLAASRFFDSYNLGLQAGIGYASFDADADRFSHSGPDAFATVTASPFDDTSVYARITWRRYDFDGLEPLFNRSRDDDELRYSLGFEQDMRDTWLAGWTLLGSWVLTDNHSNVEIFDYDRQQINIGLSKAF